MINVFAPYWLASITLAIVWSLVLIRVEKQHRSYQGICGAWAATFVLTAFWQAEAVPDLWSFLKGVLLVWLVAFCLMIMAAQKSWPIKTSQSRRITSLALLSITLNVAAGLHFLWLATVSPGGV